MEAALSAVNNLTQQYTNSSSINNKTDESFLNLLQDAIKLTEETGKNDMKANEQLLNGTTEDLHTIMIDTEKAKIALSLTLQIRNKVIDAYNEIMRTQI